MSLQCLSHTEKVLRCLQWLLLWLLLWLLFCRWWCKSSWFPLVMVDTAVVDIWLLLLLLLRRQRRMHERKLRNP